MKLLKEHKVAEVKMSYQPKREMKLAPKIAKSSDAARLFAEFWEDMEYRESFKIMLLNRGNKVIGIVPLFVGGITGTVVDVRIILQAALLSNAVGIILAHNHPSGTMKPSVQDLALTKNVKNAMSLLDLSLLDHLILSDDGYYSMSDEGEI